MKNYFSKLGSPLTLCLILIIVSCTKDEVVVIPEVAEAPQIETESAIVLGEQLENPYSIENMQKALDNLQKTGKYGDAAKRGKINTTHLYVKFKPNTFQELNLLKQDSTLILYDYPLDREITGNGDHYHDPSVPENSPTPQYASVKVDYQIPSGVEYTVLENLYIPDEDGDFTSNKNDNNTSKSFTYDLVDESLRLTGNLEKGEVGSSISAKSKWTPAGTIQVWDTRAREFIPVSGVQVLARRWFTTHKGFSNNTGRYVCDGRFRRDANYSIKWERYEFSITTGGISIGAGGFSASGSQAVLNGPKRRGDWNQDLGRNGGNTVNDTQQYYATVHQAALDYYYGSRLGLGSPQRNAAFKRQMKIAAVRDGGVSSHARQRRIYKGADISLKAWGNTSQVVYGTMTHELAHSAHWVLNKSEYNRLVDRGYVDVFFSEPLFNSNNPLYPAARNARRTLETWASTIEIVLTRHRYRNVLRVNGFVYTDNDYQNQTIAGDPFYTSAGYDMLEGVNQGTAFNGRPIDNVSGFTIVQLETAMRGVTSWEEWRNNIFRQNPNNATRNNLNELFANWN